MEDAALLRPEVGPPLVFTVDFITPIVDDPRTYGAIAAANAISDVYAMGGEPQVALAVCGFPEEEVSRDILAEIFQGGRDKAAEAGCAIAGGHTVLDPELKYGLCVLGVVDPQRVLSQTGAQVGDRLVLTKPIGSGIGAQAIKQERLSEQELDEVCRSMTLLNRGAKDAALAAGATAATDVTGFGLLGHLQNLLLGSGVAARLYSSAVPTFSFTRSLARDGLIPGGSRKNLRYVESRIRFDPALDEIDRLILADAQTSGGLLISVPEAGLPQLLSELERNGSIVCAQVGAVIDGDAGFIEVAVGDTAAARPRCRRSRR